jgi:hypothetical protein
VSVERELIRILLFCLLHIKVLRIPFSSCLSVATEAPALLFALVYSHDEHSTAAEIVALM